MYTVKKSANVNSWVIYDQYGESEAMKILEEYNKSIREIEESKKVFHTLYDEAISRVYIDKGKKPEYIEPVYIWYAYKDGKSKEFETKSEAERFSSLIQMFIKNKDEYENNINDIREYENLIYDTFIKLLRDEYRLLTDKQFSILYAEANDTYHSSGHREVEYGMRELYDFIIAFNDG